MTTHIWENIYISLSTNSTGLSVMYTLHNMASDLILALNVYRIFKKTRQNNIFAGCS